MQTKQMIKYFFLFIATIFVFACSAQEIEKEKPAKEKKKAKYDADKVIMLVPNYSLQFPFEDMAKRFGINSLFTAQIALKTRKNWIIGGEGSFLYGGNVKQNYILDGVETSTGQFITSYNDLTYVKLEEFGFNIKFDAGKIFPVSKRYPNAGIMILTSAGFLQHKISINVKPSELPQFSPAYKKGYDRMANGPVISQFLGGVFMARKKYVNAYLGAQIDVGFTEGRRPYDFYLMEPLHDKRIDLFIGIRAGWIIPIFRQSAKEEYFFR
jgi:hypothetical protein